MTTQVTVVAHCADTKEVLITLTEGEKVTEHVLQDTEEKVLYVYDSRSITVLEVEKD